MTPTSLKKCEPSCKMKPKNKTVSKISADSDKMLMRGICVRIVLRHSDRDEMRTRLPYDTYSSSPAGNNFRRRSRPPTA